MYLLLASRRQNRAEVKADRGDRVTAYLNDQTYKVIDASIEIGRDLGTTPAAVALAWVQGRSGVASTIIGARRLQRLDDNLAALDVTLDPAQAALLDRLSEPALAFPAPVLKMANSLMHGGATVNQEPSQSLLPRSSVKVEVKA